MQAEMTIGFDAKRYFHNASGLGSYARNLIDSWTEAYPDDRIYLFTPNPPPTEPARSKGNGSPTIVRPNGGLMPGSIWRSTAPFRACIRLGVPIYHGLSGELPLALSWQNQKAPRQVVTVHDVLFEKFTAQYAALDRQVYRLKTRHACRSADLIVAISSATARDLQEIYRVPKERIQVIYQTVHADFARRQPEAPQTSIHRRSGLPALYVLCTGSIFHRKNQLGLLQAYTTLPSHLRFPLIFAGTHNSDYGRQVQKFAHEHLKNAPITFLGSVSHKELIGLVQGAFFTVYISRGEGFGLPVTESLSAGVPVLTSSVSSMPEAAVGLGVLADPEHIDSVAAGWAECAERNEDLRHQIRSHQHRLEPFRGRNQIEQLRQLYATLL